MTANKRLWGLVACVLFAGLVALQVWRTPLKGASPAVTLPDGSTLRLVETGYGKEHYQPGKWWHRLARPLPAKWHRRLGLNMSPAMTTSEPALGLWFEHGNPVGHTWWDYGLVDAHGEEAPANSSHHFESTPSGPGGPKLLGRTFTAFPRRGATVGLRVYARDRTGGRTQIAAFDIPNPVRDKSPEWRPQPMPAVVKQGDLEIAFQRLLVGVNNHSKPGLPGRGEEGHARADFQLTQAGAPSEHWFPDGMELADATGNVVRQNSWSGNTSKGNAYMTWRPYLWPGETAWKIRAEFMRNEKAAFSTNELIEVKGLVLPAVDEVTELNFSTNRLGHTVRVLGMSNGKGKFPGRTHSMGGTQPRIEVEVTPELTGKRLTVMNVRDDQGRKVESRGWGRGGGSYSFSYEPKADAKSLDFTLVVQEVVIAEFLVKPEQLSPVKTTTK